MISRRGELTSRAPPRLSAWVPFPDWAQEARAQGKHRGPAELKSKQRVCSSQSGWNLQGKAPEEKNYRMGVWMVSPEFWTEHWAVLLVREGKTA